MVRRVCWVVSFLRVIRGIGGILRWIVRVVRSVAWVGRRISRTRIVGIVGAGGRVAYSGIRVRVAWIGIGSVGRRIGRVALTRRVACWRVAWALRRVGWVAWIWRRVSWTR